MRRLLVDRARDGLLFRDTLRLEYERDPQVSSKVHFLYTGECYSRGNMDTFYVPAYEKLEECDVSFDEDSIRGEDPPCNEMKKDNLYDQYRIYRIDQKVRFDLLSLIELLQQSIIKQHINKHYQHCVICMRRHLL